MAITTILKYPGNKRKTMKSIVPFMGNTARYKRYIEPFCGALGSVINVPLRPGTEILLSDLNWDVINLYEQLRLDAEAVEKIANSLPQGKAGYLDVRAWDRDPGWRQKRSPQEQAARFIYLNKTCFNGLTRYNKQGQFNTPWGHKQRKVSIDITSERASLDTIRRSKFFVESYESSIARAGEGDLIYSDPPYINTDDPKKAFNGYMSDFTWGDQIKLRDLLVEASERGAYVVASNSECDAAKQLYSGFNIYIVGAERYISCKSSGRGKCREIIAVLPPGGLP